MTIVTSDIDNITGGFPFDPEAEGMTGTSEISTPSSVFHMTPWMAWPSGHRMKMYCPPSIVSTVVQRGPLYPGGIFWLITSGADGFGSSPSLIWTSTPSIV